MSLFKSQMSLIEAKCHYASFFQPFGHFLTHYVNCHFLKQVGVHFSNPFVIFLIFVPLFNAKFKAKCHFLKQNVTMRPFLNHFVTF